MADDVTTPSKFFAWHVYIPPSCGVTSLIIRVPRDCTIRLLAGRLEFCFSVLRSQNSDSISMCVQFQLDVNQSHEANKNRETL